MPRRKLKDPGDPAIRQSGIGGSDSAAIAGLNKWRTPLDVYLEKRGLTDDLDSEAAEWGNILEPVLLRQYAKRREVFVLGRDEDGKPTMWDPEGNTRRAYSLAHLVDTIRDPVYAWRMCHLDGVVLDDEGLPVKLLEGKTSSAYRSGEWGDEDTDEVPEEYVIQCQHNAGVFNAAHKMELPVDVVALIGGQKFRVYQVAYRKSLDERLLGMEREFWGRVQEEDAPDPTERDAPALARLYPADEGEERVVGPESSLNSLALHLSEVRAEEKKISAVRAQAEVDFKAEMKDLAKMIGDGWQVTWKKSKDGEKVDWEAAFIELAEVLIGLGEGEKAAVGILRDHTSVTPGTRRFVFKWTGTEEEEEEA